MSLTMISSDWCCVDCLFWLANGEAPGDTADEKTAWIAAFNERNADVEITLGLPRAEHDCLDNGETAGDRGGECDCETKTFSWSPCDTCGSNLGGQRDAVTFWK